MKMGHAFPPILDRNELPRRVLVLVAHPDDEVIGIGGLLAFHGGRGDEVRVVHATTGGAGDPQAHFEDLAELRRREVTMALAELGVPAPQSFGFADGTLAALLPEFVAACAELFAEYAPGLLYTFHGGEFHTDHRAVGRAACEARSSLPAGCRVHLFGVNQAPYFGSLYDYSDIVVKKQEALACFRSQLAYLDFATKVMHRDQAATMNVELPEITHAELVLRVDLEEWPAHLEHSEACIADGKHPERVGDQREPGGRELGDEQT